MTASDVARRRLRLDVPALVAHPYLSGSLCCAPAAADLVEGELRSWRLWVSAVDVDGEHGRVDVVVADDAPLNDILEALEDLGYPAHSIDEIATGTDDNSNGRAPHVTA